MEKRLKSWLRAGWLVGLRLSTGATVDGQMYSSEPHQEVGQSRGSHSFNRLSSEDLPKKPSLPFMNCDSLCNAVL